MPFAEAKLHFPDLPSMEVSGIQLLDTTASTIDTSHLRGLSVKQLHAYHTRYNDVQFGKFLSALNRFNLQRQRDRHIGKVCLGAFPDREVARFRVLNVFYEYPHMMAAVDVLDGCHKGVQNLRLDQIP